MTIETNNRFAGKPARQCTGYEHWRNCHQNNMILVRDSFGAIIGYREKNRTEKNAEAFPLLAFLFLIALLLAVMALLMAGTIGAEARELVGEPIPEVLRKETVILSQEAQLSDEDILARVVMAEAGNQELIGKVAVAATVLNRAEMRDQTVTQVVSAKNQYAWPYYGIVEAECYEAVRIAMTERDLFPRNMIYFRTEHYHKIGTPYIQIEDHYFSTEGNS